MKHVKGEFFVVPNKTQFLELSMHAKSVYVVLCLHSNKDHKSRPSIRRICKIAKISHNSVTKALKELTAAGLVSIEEGTRALANEYQINIIGVSTQTQAVCPARLATRYIKQEEIGEGSPFDFNLAVQKLVDSDRPYMRLIGVYLFKQAEDFDLSYVDSDEQIQAMIKRNVRVAKQIVVFKKQAINEAFEFVRTRYAGNPKYEWTLETVFKRLAK